MIESLHWWLREHLHAVVFLGALVDAIGVPFPGRIMLITVGSFSGPAQEDGPNASLLIAIATAGTVSGDHVWYLLGRVGGRRLFEAYCRAVRLSTRRIAAADRLLRRFGGLALVLARLAATLRAVVTPLAVSRGMSYRRFLAFDLLGALLWTAGFVWLGQVAGALGARGGVIGTLVVVGTLGSACVLMSLMARRWLARHVRLS